MRLTENRIWVFVCSRVLSAHKDSASKFISLGKLDFSKSKTLNSVHEENLEDMTLRAELPLARQCFAFRLQKTQISVFQDLVQRRVNALRRSK